MPMEFEGYHQVVVSISWEQDEQPNGMTYLLEK